MPSAEEQPRAGWEAVTYPLQQQTSPRRRQRTCCSGYVCGQTSSIACGIKAATQITGLIAKLTEITLYYDIFPLPVPAV